VAPADGEPFPDATKARNPLKTTAEAKKHAAVKGAKKGAIVEESSGM
jgi:hypothetical protein